MMRKKIILSTEHGQRGGDEVNLIFDNENGKVSNYGWPIASYSDYYGYENSSIKKIAPFKKNHKKFGFCRTTNLLHSCYWDKSNY